MTIISRLALSATIRSAAGTALRTPSYHPAAATAAGAVGSLLPSAHTAATTTTAAAAAAAATFRGTCARPFAQAAAGAPEQEHAKAESNQYGMGTLTVADLLVSKGGEKKYTCKEADLVYDAVKEMVKHNIGSLVVVAGWSTEPVGIVTERDYLEKVIVLGRSSKTTHVRDIMSEKSLISVSPSATLNACMDLMSENRVRHIPVVEGRLLKGLISIGDVVKALVESQKRMNDAMRSYIGGTY